MKQLEEIAGCRSVPVEDPVGGEVLRTNSSREVLPTWILGICRRTRWTRAGMAEGARHADAIRTDEGALRVVRRIAVEPLRVPELRLLRAELWVREQTQTEDAR